MNRSAVVHGPGPEERKLRNRLWFRLVGTWPRSVVMERLWLADLRRRLDCVDQMYRKGNG